MTWGTSVIGLADLVEDFGDLKTRLDGTTVYKVGTNAEYAVFVEFGTSRMRAQPYLRPAVRETMREADALATEASSADDLVRRVALTIERKAKGHAPVDTGNLKASIRAEKLR